MIFHTLTAEMQNEVIQRTQSVSGKMKQKLLVSQIQNFSLHDGP